MSNSTEIAFANYAIPAPVLLTASMDRVGEYAVSVGTHKLRIAPLKVRHVRQLCDQHDYPFIAELYQSYRGERTWREVLSWAWREEISLKERPAKIAIAAKSKLTLPHRSHSILALEQLGHSIKYPVDYMLQWDAIKDQPLAPTSTIRRVQLTEEVVNIQPNETDIQKAEKIHKLPDILHQKGIKAGSFHLISSLPLILDSNGKINRESLATVAKVTDEIDFTLDRNDLVTSKQLPRGIESWLGRKDSIEREILASLRDAGCSIRRIVFAITPSAIYSLNNSRKRGQLKGKQREIIDSLREI